MIASKFIFLFLDGVGLAQPHANQTAADVLINPLTFPDVTPFLTQTLGGSLLSSLKVSKPEVLFKAVDACLGVAGLPQSATGQTTLYTGRNAPASLGRHQTGFANGSLRVLIEESGIFKQVLELGGSATHANLYLPDYFEAIAQRRWRYSVGTLLTLTANLPFRLTEAYAQGEAIYWDITGQLLQDRKLAHLTPQEAGQRLAHISEQHHITLFECYLPDFAGHAQDLEQSRQVLCRIDAFLESIVTHMSPQSTLIVSSDHGNIENLSTKRHTFNPVPLLVMGPHAATFNSVEDISGITPKILEIMTVEKAMTFTSPSKSS